MACSVALFAQKKEVKTLEKAVKSANFAEAKTAAAAAEKLLGTMDAKTKEKFYVLKGKAYSGGNNKNIEDLKIAAAAFEQVQNNSEATNGKLTILQTMVNSAVENQNSKDYAKASNTLYEAYKLSPQDTSYLYFAGTNAINAQDFPIAIKYYEELRSLNYTGREVTYTAIEKSSGEKKTFSSKEERDIVIRASEYIKPAQELTPSKKGDIVKALASMYINVGENEKALSTIDEAIKEDPDDLNTIVSKANVYLRLGRREDFFNTMKDLIAKEPDNATWHFNLGIGNTEAGNKEEAFKNYEKAIELDENYGDAYKNLVSLIVADDEEITKEMNSLGTSKADFDRFDELKLKRKEVLSTAIPYLNKALDIDSKNREMTNLLYQIHQTLGNQSEADAIKARLDALPGGQ